MYGNLFSDFILRLSIGLILIVVLSIIIHYIIVRLKFKDLSFDNPSSIAIVLSILYVVVSYLPKFKLVFFIITNTIIPFALIRQFYNISWKLALKFWLIWVAIMLGLTMILATLVILIF